MGQAGNDDSAEEAGIDDGKEDEDNQDEPIQASTPLQDPQPNTAEDEEEAEAAMAEETASASSRLLESVDNNDESASNPPENEDGEREEEEETDFIINALVNVWEVVSFGRL